MHRLNLLVSPIKNESPTSYLSRTAYANGFKNLKHLKNYLECSCTTAECLLANSKLIRALLQDNKDLPSADLSFFYKHPSNAHKYSPFIVNGIKVPYRFVRTVEGARCPICIESGWEHYIKDIKLLQQCPLHNTPYILECPNCHKRTDWDAQLLDHCKCGYKITSNKHAPLVDATAERAILKIFEDRSQEQFYSLLSALHYSNHPLFSNLKPIDRTLLNAAVSVTLNDPQILIEHLETLSKQYPHIDRRLLLEKLPPIRNQIIGEAYSTFLSTTSSPPIQPSLAIMTEPTFSHNQVRKYLNLSMRQWLAAVKTLTSEGLFSNHERFTAEKINLIHETLLTATAQRTSDQKTSAMSLTDVAVKLEVDKERIRQTVNSGFLEAFKIKGKFHITKESLDSFNEKYVLSSTLARELQIPPHALKMRLTSLAIRPISGHKIDGNFTYLLLRKDVAHLTKDMILLRSPADSKLDKRNYYKSLPALASKGNSYLDCTEAAMHLSLPVKLIRQLCRTGLLGNIHRLSNQKKYLIPKAEVEIFNNEYIGCRELKMKLNLPQNLVSSTLKTIGISQATGLLVDGQKTPFFRRGDITIDTYSRVQSELLAHFRTSSKTRSAYLSLSDAARRIGIKRKQLNSLIEQRILTTKTPAPGLLKHQTGVLLSSISKYEARISSQIPLQVALYKLGISRQKFHLRFTASGFLKLHCLHNDLYLTKRDLRRATDNLDEFCDFAEADRLLAAQHGYTRRNIASHHLIAVSPTETGNITTITLLNKTSLLEHFSTPNKK